MYNELKGKVALITGSTKGIGRGIAEKYAALGIKLVLNYSSDEQSAKETVDAIKEYGGEYLLVKGDMSNPEQIEKLFDQSIWHFGKRRQRSVPGHPPEFP